MSFQRSVLRRFRIEFMEKVVYSQIVSEIKEKVFEVCQCNRGHTLKLNYGSNAGNFTAYALLTCGCGLSVCEKTNSFGYGVSVQSLIARVVRSWNLAFS